MHPAAADHRRNDLEVPQLLRLDGERVAIEHDEVGEQPRQKPAAPPFVAGEKGRSDAVACSACSTVSVSSGRQAGRSSIERSTPAAMPAIGSSSSTGASDPFATSAPDSSSERKE